MNFPSLSGCMWQRGTATVHPWRHKSSCPSYRLFKNESLYNFTAFLEPHKMDFTCLYQVSVSCKGLSRFIVHSGSSGPFVSAFASVCSKETEIWNVGQFPYEWSIELWRELPQWCLEMLLILLMIGIHQVRILEANSGYILCTGFLSLCKDHFY